MKICSWNVNGLRAILKKGDLQHFLQLENPDIICLQETKAKEGQAEIDLPEYQEIWNSADRPGYSGTAIFTKIKPLKINYNFAETSPNNNTFADLYGNSLSEGRVLSLEFEKFFLVNVYTPNSKADLSRLDFRQNVWDPYFLNYINHLATTKPVIVCGDFNAAHTAIDLARPKDNEFHAGFTQEERQAITNLTNSGFIDSFRTLHPNEIAYTWWSMRTRAREHNIGWRIDYFFISAILQPKLQQAQIYSDVFGSDHCPISVKLDF